MSEAIQLDHAPRGDEKHAAIVEAARSVFLEKGFAGASMDEIAAVASVSKRTVYNRFSSKDELFGAVIIATCERLLPLIDQNIGAAPDQENLVRTAEQILTEILTPEAVSLRRITAFESARFPQLGRAFLENGIYRLIDALTPRLQKFIEEGYLEIDDIPLAIMQLGALVSEPLETQMDMGVTPDDLPAAIKHQARTGVEAFLKIYGTGKKFSDV